MEEKEWIVIYKNGQDGEYTQWYEHSRHVTFDDAEAERDMFLSSSSDGWHSMVDIVSIQLWEEMQ